MGGSVKSDMYKKCYSAIKIILQKHAYWIEKDIHDILKSSFLFYESHILNTSTRHFTEEDIYKRPINTWKILIFISNQGNTK